MKAVLFRPMFIQISMLTKVKCTVRVLHHNFKTGMISNIEYPDQLTDVAENSSQGDTDVNLRSL